MTISKLAGAALSVAALGGLSSGALFTYEIEYVSGASGGYDSGLRQASVNAGDTLTLRLYGVSYDGNSNPADDGQASIFGRLISAKTGTLVVNNGVTNQTAYQWQGGGILGNFLGGTNVTLFAPLNSPLGGGVGSTALKDVDGDGDIDVGNVLVGSGTTTNSLNGSTVSDFWASSNGLVTSSSGTPRLALADIAFTVTTLDPSGADLYFLPRIRVIAGTSANIAKFKSDGTEYSKTGFNTTDLAVSAPITLVSVPEPATVGIMGLAAMAALSRRPKKK